MSAWRRRIEWWASRLLRFRHFVVWSTILFLTVTGFAFYVVYHDAVVMHEEINANFNQQQLILARQAASEIDRTLTGIRVEMEMLERVLPGASEATGRTWLQAALERTRSSGVLAIGLADGQGRLVQVEPAGAEGAALQEAIGQGSFPAGGRRLTLGPLQTEVAARSPARITSVLGTRLEAGSRAGMVLLARIDVTELVARVTRPIRSGQTGYAWVIDQTERFLYHPEQEFIGRQASEARERRQPYIRFTEINRIMKDQMIRGQEGTGTYVSGWHRGVEGEMTKLIAFTPVTSACLQPDHVWSVAVAAPTREVADVVGRVRERHYLLGLALVGVLFIFGLLVANYQHRISLALKEQVKRTEAQRRKTERLYERIVEQASDMIYILDLDGRFVLLNQPTVKLLSGRLRERPEAGRPDEADLERAETYIGRRVDEVWRPEDAAVLRQQISRVLQERKRQGFHHTVTLGGTLAYLNTVLLPIRDEEGGIQQILGITRDETERRTLEQRLYNTEKLASIGTLAAGVAHEINNPLAVILGFTDLLLERTPPGTQAHEDLKMIEDNANHAKQIVENLLGFARITEGLEDVVDVAHGVRTVLNIVRNTLMTKKIALEVRVPENLPRVRGDPREFQQVIFNLISNSVAAMERGGGTLTVSAWVDEGSVRVSVADTGVGIPDAIKPRVLDPFFTTKKAGEGTGLGLSLCYGIVKKYGGRLDFTSRAAEDGYPGPTGTTFIVSLPVLASEESPPAKDAPHEATLAGRG